LSACCFWSVGLPKVLSSASSSALLLEAANVILLPPASNLASKSLSSYWPGLAVWSIPNSWMVRSCCPSLWYNSVCDPTGKKLDVLAPLLPPTPLTNAHDPETKKNNYPYCSLKTSPQRTQTSSLQKNTRSIQHGTLARFCLSLWKYDDVHRSSCSSSPRDLRNSADHWPMMATYLLDIWASIRDWCSIYSWRVAGWLRSGIFHCKKEVGPCTVPARAPPCCIPISCMLPINSCWTLQHAR